MLVAMLALYCAVRRETNQREGGWGWLPVWGVGYQCRVCRGLATCVGCVGGWLPVWGVGYQCGGLATCVGGWLPVWGAGYLCGGLATYVGGWLPVWGVGYLCRG